MFLTAIAPESGKIYQKRTYNIPTDMVTTNSSLIWVRGRLYEDSKIIQQKSNSCIVEIVGYLSLSEKFHIWSEYGQPELDIYFCVEDGRIVEKDELHRDNGYIWPIGWISKEGYVIVYVDLLMLLNSYYNLSNTKKIGTPSGIGVYDAKQPVLQLSQTES